MKRDLASAVAVAVWCVLCGMVGRLPAARNASGPSEAERARIADEVRRIELAFAAAVTENRPADFAAHLDDEAVFVGGAGVLRGKQKIVAAWSGYFGEGRPHFEWHPEIVEVSRDGTLGITRGPWTLRATDADGKATAQSGLFNSIWQRQSDGSWRIVFDAGCAPCPACSS